MEALLVKVWVSAPDGHVAIEEEVDWVVGSMT